MTTPRRIPLFALLLVVASNLEGADSVTPYDESNVPQNALDLWRDVDFREDPLETKLIKEWNEDGVVCRYVIFKVGTFQGADSVCAAFYTFPVGKKRGPAFVWAHGGGQRADRNRGKYFAKQGFATLDYNWGGRELVEGVKENTEWGKVDPSQGPRFYPGALRPHVKLNLLPDEHTIDSVVSPRNGNWYLLAYAGRRAITFLERQEEVDPEKIGFTGFSMGGNITSMVAIDKRLKAVIPMVGGSGFIMDDFPGLPHTGRARGYRHVDLYNRTVDAQAYWPHVTCPVLFLSASDDFHAVFDNIYKSVNRLPHKNWRASHLMHYNHSLGPQQWILVNRWFERHLNGQGEELPKSVKPDLHLSKTTAQFRVAPDRANTVEKLDIYYSHDPNARARFWNHAESTRSENTWSAELPVRDGLPLYAFANITYPLEKPAPSFHGTAHNFTITSDEAVHIPDDVKIETLRAGAKHVPVFEDFEANGIRDWSATPHGGILTFKFQDPTRATPGIDKALKITITVPRKLLRYGFRIGKRQFLAGVKGRSETFFVNRHPKVGERQIILRASDFTNREKKAMKNWSEISTFRFDIYDGEARRSLHFTDPENLELISKIEWVDG